MLNRKQYSGLMIFFIFFTAISIQAQPDDSVSKKKYTPPYDNEIMVFIGGTSYIDHQGDYFSAGLEYARRLSPGWGVGIWGEAIFASHTEWTAGALIIRNLGHFFVRAGGGIEILQEEVEHSLNHETESHVELLLRVGLGYAYHIDRFLIAPVVDVDFVRTTTALVYGVNFGYNF